MNRDFDKAHEEHDLDREINYYDDEDDEDDDDNDDRLIEEE